MSEQNNNESQYKRAFNDKDEFMKYYNEHKEEIDKLTTKQLNSVYKIESCKITRNKNKIVVRSNSPKSKDKKEDKEDKEVKPKQKSNKKEIKPTDLNKMIDSLINHYEKQILQLKEMKNKIVSDNLFDSDAILTNGMSSARQEQHNE